MISADRMSIFGTVKAKPALPFLLASNIPGESRLAAMGAAPPYIYRAPAEHGISGLEIATPQGDKSGA